MSCSKNPQKEILGKWELVSYYAEGGVSDRWGDTIYEFKDNGIVVISNMPDETIGHTGYTEEYSCRFADNPSGYGGLSVVINGEYYDCCISKNCSQLPPKNLGQ